MADTHRLVGVAAPQRQQPPSLGGMNGVIQASSVGMPLHLIARSGEPTTATAANRLAATTNALSSWSALGNTTTSNNNNSSAAAQTVATNYQQQTQPQLMLAVSSSSSSSSAAVVDTATMGSLLLDHWQQPQQQQQQQLRVPLASPEGGALLSSASSSSTSSTSAATTNNNNSKTTSGRATSRFYMSTAGGGPYVSSSSTSTNNNNNINSSEIPATINIHQPSSQQLQNYSQEARLVSSSVGGSTRYYGDENNYNHLNDLAVINNNNNMSTSVAVASGSNGSTVHQPAIIRPQTFHATSSVPLPGGSNGGTSLLFPIVNSSGSNRSQPGYSRHQPSSVPVNNNLLVATNGSSNGSDVLLSEGGAGSAGSGGSATSDSTSTVTIASADDTTLNNTLNANLDFSSSNLLARNCSIVAPSSVIRPPPTGGSMNNSSSTPATTNVVNSAAATTTTLPPLELVEQLNRVLTIGDLGLPPSLSHLNNQQPPSFTDAPLLGNSRSAMRSYANHRRAGFLIDDAAGGGDSSSSQQSSPRDLAARRLRSVSMPLVQVGGVSSRTQFDGDAICGERLPRQTKAIRHIDLQSVKFALSNAIAVLEQVTRTAKTPSNLNTTTGASAATLGSVRLYDDLSQCGTAAAASASSSSSTVVVASAAPELRDPGDGRSNSVVQSCPYFRNEISTEEVRSVHLGRATVAKQMQKLVAMAANASNHRTSSSSADDPNTSQYEQNNNNNSSSTTLLCGVPHPICNGITVLDSALSTAVSEGGDGSIKYVTEDSLRVFGGFRACSNFVVEHHDFGAHYYRHIFYGKEHRNYLANHPVFGPIVVSLLREKSLSKNSYSMLSRGFIPQPSCAFQHKIIVRTADMVVLRGSIPEELIPCLHSQTSTSSKHHSKHSNKHSSDNGNSSRNAPSACDILTFVLPELNNINIFRSEIEHDRVATELLKIDEQNVRYKYKVGVIFCRPGQTTEEEFYNNSNGSDLFDEFLDLLGRRVPLRNFQSYSGGLDTKADTTGTESVYASFAGYEVMFHVSTLLPFSPTNRQQLLRKRHIGNDVVTIIFQEPGSQPFTPRSIRSQYQHVFIIVRPVLSASVNGHVVGYQVAVSRAKDVPYFGPLLPPDGLFARCPEFGQFLLMKAINAENAVVKSGKFVAMSLRTRRELLLDLVNNWSSSDSIVADSSTGSSNGSSFGSSGASRLMARLSFRRVFREKASFLHRSAAGGDASKLASSQPSLVPVKNFSSSGGYAWNVVLVDCGQGGRLVQATLVVSTDDFILLDRESPPSQTNNAQFRANSLEPGCDSPSMVLLSPAVFCVPVRSILGYRVQHTDLRLYYHKGESIILRSVDGSVEEIEEIVARITAVSGVVEYVQAVHCVAEVSLSSPVGLGRFGFLCSAQGVVLRVDDGGPASIAGLRAGCRIIEVFGIALRALTGAQLRELFQTAQNLRLSILPALPSGAPRQSRVPPETPTMYWLPQYFHSMSPEFLTAVNCGSNNSRVGAEVDAEETPVHHSSSHLSHSQLNGSQNSSQQQSTVTPRSSIGSAYSAVNGSAVLATSTPLMSSAYANRIYAELPLQSSAQRMAQGDSFKAYEPRGSTTRTENRLTVPGSSTTTPMLAGSNGNETVGNSQMSFASARSQAQSTDSLVEVGNGTTSGDFFTPAALRRPILLPATNPGSDNMMKATPMNGSNYQLHRWPMNNGNVICNGNGNQQQQQQQGQKNNQFGDGNNSESSNLFNAAGSSSTIGLLEAQLAVERSRRLAAEHELASAQEQLAEMRAVVRRFADWFLAGSSMSFLQTGQEPPVAANNNNQRQQWPQSVDDDAHMDNSV